MDTNDVIDYVISSLQQAKGTEESALMFDDKNLFIININVVERASKRHVKKPRGYPADFEKLWDAWPRKEAKAFALVEFYHALKGRNETTDRQMIVDAGILQANDEYSKRDPEFVPLLANWFKSCGWNNDFSKKQTVKEQEMISGKEISMFINNQIELNKYSGDALLESYATYVRETREQIPFYKWVSMR